MRITNITKDGYLNYDDLIYISEELGNSLSRTQVKQGDIVISQRGSLGQCAIVDNVFEKMNISANVIAVKNIQETSAEFIHDYFLSTIGQTLLERNISGQVQQKITSQDIADFPIVLPDYEKQVKLASKLERVFVSKNQKLNEANILLKETSFFVLEKMLHLTFDITEQPKMYAIKMLDIDRRMDVDFYSPRFLHFRKQIENCPYNIVTIEEISDKIISGFAAGKQDQADDLSENERVSQLRPFSITPEGELSFVTQKYVPKSRLKDSDYCKKNEVIFNNTNSPEWVGKTTVFDAEIQCTTSNHMTRITVKDGINPYYVSAIFNVLLSIGYWKLLCTNFNNQAGINSDTLKNVKIPLPPKELQDAIAQEVMSRRVKANRLRKEAAKEWKLAKEQFEKELLEDLL